MKKFLAILLAVVMLFTLGIAAFADDDADETTVAEMPANIGLQEGKIVLSIDNTYIEASQTYKIPIRLYADYASKIPEDAEKLYIGANGIELNGTMSASDYATVTSVECTDLIPEENQIAIGYDEEYGETYFAFTIDKADFGTFLSTPEEGIIVGYVTIETTENVPTEYGVDFGTLGIYGTYDFGWNFDELYGTAGYTDAEGNFTPFDLAGNSDDDIIFDTACFYHVPKVATWQEKLKDWAKEQGLLFLGFFITVLSVLEELLKQA